MEEVRRLLEQALALIPNPEPAYRNWDWLSQFDEEDLATFVAELQALLPGGSAREIDQAIFAWERSAELLADPVYRQILQTPFREEDFVEVGRPGGEETEPEES